MVELVFELGWAGWAVLIVRALVFRSLRRIIGETRTGFEWLIDAIAFGVGALVASEFIIGQTFEPVHVGLALVPALLGGLVVGIVARSSRAS